MFIGNFDLFAWVIVPILIVFTRIIDVSMGTLRIVFISRGHKLVAPIIGFFEIIVWLLAMATIMQNLDNWVYFIAYALGFSLGNYVGLVIEEKLAIGTLSVRVITRKKASSLIEALRNSGYRTTTIRGEGVTGPVDIIYVIVKRKKIEKVIRKINEYNPKAFYTIEEVKSISKSVFMEPQAEFFGKIRFRKRRKSKL